MPHWMTALGVAGMLCLPLAHGVCQAAGSSLAHYLRGEAFLQEDNLQSAANEFLEALTGDSDAAWTVVWSHIHLGRIFDASGQHDRAVNEYRQAQQTGDNTDGALDQANDYLKHAEHAIYLRREPSPAAIGEPIQRTDPEYTEEARLAELEGTVILNGDLDEEGFARNLKVAESLGLGLDENAIEAVKQWRFPPQVNQSQQPRAATQFEVDFRLLTHQSRWHLIQVQFDTQPGTARPVFVSALYPIGAGLGPEAMEDGRLVVAMDRMATARLRFEVDEHGLPVNFQILNTSDPVWGGEATALVGQGRFKPGMNTGIAVRVPCTVELVWGQRELKDDLQRQLHDVLAAR
jgi:TonB family protein